MRYTVTRNTHYDFAGQSSSTLYPNLHKYPATMLPQIGIAILKECGISSGKLLDPYCGSGSSFICGIECGIKTLHGFDLNPLAVLISKVRYTALPEPAFYQARQELLSAVFDFLKNEDNLANLQKPKVTNIDFWLSKSVCEHLALLKFFIDKISEVNIRNFFLLAFSETVRDCSYTRNNEFKLFRMKLEDLLNFNPDVISVFFKYLDNIFDCYKFFYLPKIKSAVSVEIKNEAFKGQDADYEVVLTSPPYGDSRTTVAYGQFSTLANEWMVLSDARKLDSQLMGRGKCTGNICDSLIGAYISEIEKIDAKRALEVSSFYNDLGGSIKAVANSIKPGGKAIYIVGNRTIKEVQLPTDQFIAEQFEAQGFRHLVTYERLLGSKSMPSRNSPSNKAGKTASTMLNEYIIVCEKTV